MSGAVLDDEARQQDGLLVQRHRDGDATAFAELYATYHRRLLRFVRRRVNEDHIAEDLTHEAFTRALSGIGNFRDGARFYSWLIGIARHLLIRHYRDTGRVATLTHVDAGPIDAPELQLMRRVEQEYMTAALGRVRTRHREVLRLREDEELSYEAIAERLGIPLTTVPPLLHRARLALRREYLAVTEPERTAAILPLLYGATAALRRLRDRLLQVAAHVPNSATVTASMAVAAISVASLLSPPPSDIDVGLRAKILAPGPSAHTAQEVASQPHDQIIWPAFSTQSGDTTNRHGDVTSATRYQPDVAVDQAEMRRRRADSQHMPYSTNVGPTWIGVDPDQMQRDLQSSLTGDFEWMEGS